MQAKSTTRTINILSYIIISLRMDSSDEDIAEEHRDMPVGPAAQRALAALSDSDGEDEPRIPAPLTQQRRQRCVSLRLSLRDTF